jgi:hypothetical protein
LPSRRCNAGTWRKISCSSFPDRRPSTLGPLVATRDWVLGRSTSRGPSGLNRAWRPYGGCWLANQPRTSLPCRDTVPTGAPSQRSGAATTNDIGDAVGRAPLAGRPRAAGSSVRFVRTYDAFHTSARSILSRLILFDRSRMEPFTAVHSTSAITASLKQFQRNKHAYDRTDCNTRDKNWVAISEMQER